MIAFCEAVLATRAEQTPSMTDRLRRATCALAFACVLTTGPLSAQAQSIPDDSWTPGEVENTDASVICVAGYEQAHRVYNRSRLAYYAMALAAFARYGVPWSEHRSYELDDRCPIGIGCKNSPLNVWAQPLPEAKIKDQFERWAWFQVCRRKAMTPAQAQAMFLAPADWRDSYRQVFGHAP